MPRFFLYSAFLAAFLAHYGSVAEVTRTNKDLNTPRQFPEINTRAEWESRAAQIRQQVFVSCGLWPLPARTPLQSRIFGKIEREGYTVEKVCFQSFPGFYVAGNLYRPSGGVKGPFPGVLNPHGHWKEGRMADNNDGSVAARCINFARQGMVAFSYDMLGYNDTFFPDHGEVPVDKFYLRHRRFATNQVCLLWNISQMGLQTWNSIRALDFLESLPDVDSKRLACTGESGGGTQTFMLGAVDDRLIAQAPIVMVSHTMQGGCSCENAPGLRVEYSNMEIAAAAVPRPQILVAATGDWTRATLTVEGPAIENIYRLFNAADKLRYVRFDYNHNYNQTSREAVYDWFGKWVLHESSEPRRERPYTKEPDADLRVFPDSKLPPDAVTEDELIRSWIAGAQQRWAALLPRNKASLAEYKKMMLPSWQRTLQVGWPSTTTETIWKAPQNEEATRSINLEIKRSEGAFVVARYFPPPKNRSGSRLKNVIVLTDPTGAFADCDASGMPAGLAKKLIDAGNAVIAIKTYSSEVPKDQFANFFTTYNRTLLQQRVGDLIAVCTQARALGGGKGGKPNVILCGAGKAGVWSILAAPAADAVVADCDRLDLSADSALLTPELFCPGIKSLGAFEGAAILAAPHPVVLHNVSPQFPTGSLQASYEAIGSTRRLRVEQAALTEAELLKCISSLDR